mmetsp:Transcript_1339/g.2958  ORF Transcript_1339/g.2958 Transcript_1339/m.2958 type:complete len:169 (+) Transcript_1339:43-549(+)
MNMKNNPMKGGISPMQMNDNPMHGDSEDEGVQMGDASDGGDPDTLRTLSSASFRQSDQVAMQREGWLHKKSPSLLKGWQQRYFLTRDNGDVEYYKSEKDAHNDKAPPQGTIRVADIRLDCGLEVDDETHEITVYLAAKSVLLRAASHADALGWVSNIASWMESPPLSP